MIVNYAGIDVMASRDRVMSVFRPRELGFVPLRAHRYMRYLTVGPDGHLYITTFGFNRQTAIAGPGQLACKSGVWFGWKILIRNQPVARCSGARTYRSRGFSVVARK
jgi:hypothetical protein